METVELLETSEGCRSWRFLRVGRHGSCVLLSLQTTCTLSVLPRFRALARYNLQTLTDPKQGADKGSVGAKESTNAIDVPSSKVGNMANAAAGKAADKQAVEDGNNAGRPEV